MSLKRPLLPASPRKTPVAHYSAVAVRSRFSLRRGTRYGREQVDHNGCIHDFATEVGHPERRAPDLMVRADR